jgi:hypothetical protein
MDRPRLDITATRARALMMCGNRAYVQRRYSAAYATYATIRPQSRIPACDVHANLAMTAARLGLPSAAQSHWGQALDSATGRDVCAWARGGLALGEASPAPRARGGAWLRALMDLSARIDAGPADARLYAERCGRFRALGSARLALADAVRWAECDPRCAEAWAACGDLAHAVGDGARLAECVARLGALGAWARPAPRAERGYPPDAPARAPFPLAALCADVLPDRVECAWPAAPHLLASFFALFHRALYALDPLLGFAPDALRAAFDGAAAMPPPAFPAPLFPAGFQLAFAGRPADLERLLAGALALGRRLCEPDVPDRAAVCTALAAIEIAQLVARWARGDAAVVPHCELVTALILAWRRLADPATLIMPRSVAVLPARTPIVGGATVFVSAPVLARAFARLKELVCADLCEFLRDRAMRAENISDFLHVLQGGCLVNLDPTGASACKLSAKRIVTGGVDFNFTWEESLEERTEARGRVITAWTRLLTELKRGEATMNALEFVYTWMHAGPIGYPEGTFGYVIVSALLLVLGFAVDVPLRDIAEVEIEALLARNSTEFFQAIKLEGLRLSPAPDYPSVAQLLPNLHVRMQALRRFPFDCT